MTQNAKHIFMQNSKRALNFPYRISAVGYIFNAPKVDYVKKQFPNYIEIAIRTSKYSNATKSLQTINKIEFNNGYPHAIIKEPQITYTYQDMPIRDVFYFCYDLSLYQALQDLNIFKSNSCWDIEMTPQIDFFVKQIMELMNNSQEFGIADRLDLYCFELLSELLFTREKENKQIDNISQLISQIDSYLRFNITEDIDINMVIDHFKLSKSTFFRYWNKFHKISPRQYLLNLKLEEACRLLITSKSKIHEIAYILKFKDSAHFCLVFRKTYNITPRAYRENWQNIQKN